MLKFQLISDVHSRWEEVSFHPDAQLVLAAGDLSENDDGIRWLIDSGRPALYIPGNHEYYGSDLGTRQAQLQEICKGSKVSVLDRRTAIAGDTRILCATLWTDQYGMHPETMIQAMKIMNDFRNISCQEWFKEEAHSRRYTQLRQDFDSQHPQHAGLFPHKPEKHNPLIALLLHQDAIQYLTQELAKPWRGNTVVLTHHAPTSHSLLFGGYFTQPEGSKFHELFARKHKPHKVGSYASSLDYLFTNHRIDIWAHGHLHEGMRYSLNGTDVITNPTGYNKLQNERHQGNMLVELDREDQARHTRILAHTLDNSLSLQREALQLLRRCALHEAPLGQKLFEALTDFDAFCRIYNQCITILLQQRERDRQRPDFILEPLGTQRLVQLDSSARVYLSKTTRTRFLHEILTQVQKNESKTQEWLASVLKLPILGQWNLTQDPLTPSPVF